MFTQNHLSTIIPSFQYNWQIQNIFFQLSNGIKSFRFIYHDSSFNHLQPHVSLRTLISYSKRSFRSEWLRSSGSLLPLKSSSESKSDSSPCWINRNCTDCTMFASLFLKMYFYLFLIYYFFLSHLQRLLVLGCLALKRTPILNSIIQMRNVFIWICFRNRFEWNSESFW